MLNELIEIEAAKRLVLERVSPLPNEEVAITGALGRVLGADVESADDVPAFDNSAMDGFALQAGDTQQAELPVRLPITDESRAGRPATATLESGQAIRISTGAALPSGADSVVRVEDTTTEGEQVEVSVAVQESTNVRRAGEDVSRGDLVLRRGTILGAAELGVLAAVGRASAVCARRPTTAVLMTGDELQEPSEAPRPGGVRNANAHTVPALAALAGAEVTHTATVPDDAGATRAAIEQRLEHDVVLISGGVSVGVHDHVRPTLSELGVEQVFWGVALRPGKPSWFGVHPDGALVFGLPGNPVSAIVAFLLFARPAIQALLGATADPTRAHAIFDEAYEKQAGRAHVLRCRLELRDDGWHATPTKEQGSHILTSMVGADALAVIPTESEGVAAGDRVAIELLP
jgi:molybdopterin molybdotransferase